MHSIPTCTAFEGSHLIASGAPAEVAPKLKRAVDRHGHGSILIFDDRSASTLEIDLRGGAPELRDRLTAALAPPAQPAGEVARGPGRPKLGVVAREVTLLPQQWEWLNLQPGGASVTLRKLVERARRANEGADRVRLGREMVYRFISVMAGNAPGFEEATRALFAGDRARFEEWTRAWPKDVREHAHRLCGPAFEKTGRTPTAA
jgi:uncharacterized protein